VIAANLAGSRRVTVGAARDHFIGFKAVSGAGESFKAGGKVVKNVTGYDLPKLLAGSWGTLAVLTEAALLDRTLVIDADSAHRHGGCAWRHFGARRVGRRLRPRAWCIAASRGVCASVEARVHGGARLQTAPRARWRRVA
jgi:hypothetical protein